MNGSSAFILKQTYVLTIPASSTSSPVTVEGFYNVNTVGAGNSSLSVSVTDVAGTTVATKAIPDSATGWSDITGDVTWNVAGSDNSVHDSVDGYGYKYALVFHNGNSAMKSVTVTATLTDATAWNVAITDASGYLVQGSGSAFDIKGLADTTLYVVLTKKDDSAATTTVPGVHIDIAGDMTGNADLTAATGSLNETESSASGDKSDNNKAGLAPAFWIFTVLTILMFLVLLWSGMKRGVFSRRN